MATTRNDLIFTPTVAEFCEQRKDKSLTVLAGANNSGKSLVMKSLKRQFGRKSYMIGTNRFYHVYHISTAITDPRQADNWENQFSSQFNQEDHNYEQNFFDLNSVITSLKDSQRNELFDLCGQLIGSKFSLKKFDEDSELSMRYIDMDGQNLSVGSTGTRLLMTILGICMDRRYSIILIDEPELGLGPRVQQSLASFFQDDKERKKYFPHLEQIFITTHSHLFLDRSAINNNFIVSKADKNITIHQIMDIGDLHRLQFNLLGNSLEAMFFPSAIIIVEGKTDLEFIDRVLSLHIPGHRITVTSANGDVLRKFLDLRDAFGDFMKSPFRTRIFVVIDSVHQAGIVQKLLDWGIPQNNIVKWEQNGIEYVYPTEVMMTVFACNQETLAHMVMDGDRITVNGITKTKNELKTDVVRLLHPDVVQKDELKTKLLDRVSAMIA
jgi:predicted ATP-dependent endonuclease of OLD family